MCMSHNKNIIESVLATIKKKHLKPRPRWEFVLKNYFIWALTALTLIVGSLAFAVIIYLIKNNDWDLYRQINDGFLEFIILSLPYFWLIFLASFVLLAYYNFKHTKIGYKYHFHLILGATILISLLAGILFYNIGLGHAIDSVFNQKFPVYRRLMLQRAKIWDQPDKGLLFGIIQSVQEPNALQLQDLKNKSWLVIYRQAHFPPQLILKPGLRVKIFGQKINQNTFRAQHIRPFRRVFRKMFLNRFVPLRQQGN